MENETAPTHAPETENETVVTNTEQTSVDRLTRRLDHSVPDF